MPALITLALAFEIEGYQPIPQGSKTGFVVGRRAVLVDANKDALKPWRDRVKTAASEAHGAAEQLLGPVAVHAVFTIERPKSVRRAMPAVKPDLDKYLRALFDGITDSGAWKDDGQVVEVTARKVYAEVPGVRVRVGRVSEETKEKDA